DVRELALHFVQRYKIPGTSPRLSEALLGWLEAQPWPGNVRELANFVRRAIALSAGGEIGLDALEQGAPSTPPPGGPECRPGVSLEEMERRLFTMTLDATGGNRARAAELLGVSLRTVRNKVREFGLPPRSSYRGSNL
ncbi:MAG TPA: helix-turn-helix domain-containing protein, partial [Terriglobales bacterium]|nr:helix-turn-helix domain-containing protein [Terriglobales bacterium]